MSDPVLVSCPGCETSYDVSRRTPGKRMRCPRCKAVVVVPERAPEQAPAPHTTASGRLRRTRGPSCATHPRATAQGRCAGCGDHVCEQCWAPAPVDHFCARCAKERGLEGALPVDFGLLATPVLAFRILGQSLVRVFLWTCASILVAFLAFSIPLALSAWWFGQVYDGRQTWVSDLAAACVFGSALGMLGAHFLLIVPSGCAVFLDHAVRRRQPPLADAFREAWRRCVANAGRLVGVLVVVALLFVPCLLLLLGGAFLVDEWFGRIPAGLLLLFGIPLGFLPILTALGLAVPIVVLEDRPATAALARAWELVRQHLVTFGVLVLGYFLLVALLGGVLGVLKHALSLPPAPVGVLSQFIDVLLWPSLLVAAYHGLAAEQAGVLGRR